jgi:hypothetical protein
MGKFRFDGEVEGAYDLGLGTTEKCAASWVPPSGWDARFLSEQAERLTNKPLNCGIEDPTEKPFFAPSGWDAGSRAYTKSLTSKIPDGLWDDEPPAGELRSLADGSFSKSARKKPSKSAIAFVRGLRGQLAKYSPSFADLKRALSRFVLRTANFGQSTGSTISS